MLGGVHVEATPESLRLTATDRYRLSTRTLVPDELPAITWAATLSGDDLRAAVLEIRRRHLVHVEASAHGVRIRTGGSPDQHCRILPGDFPDYQPLLSALPAPGTRTLIPREALLRAIEAHDDDHVQLHVSPDTVRLGPPGGTARHVLPAVTTGPDTGLVFRVTTLYPAVSTTIGPDVMLDIRAPGQPVIIRSADNGDLTTLAMPAQPGNSPARPDPREGQRS